MECPNCQSKNVRPHSGVMTLVVGLIMLIVGTVFGKGPGEIGPSDPTYLYTILGIGSGFGLVITIMAVFGMIFGKHTCKDCKNKWR